MYKILLLSLLLSLALSVQEVPVPIKNYGLTVGDPYGTLQIDFTFDFLCGGCQEHYFLWKKLRQEYGLVDNKIKLTYQFHTLPYHFYSTVIHQAFYYVLRVKGSAVAEQFIDYIFTTQDDYQQENTLNYSLTYFVKFLGKRLTTLGIDADLLATELLATDSDSKTALKNVWRFSTIQRGLPGTPFFFANGVVIDGAESFEYQDWVDFLNKYKK